MSAPRPKWVEYADASRLMARGLVLHPMQKHTLWLEALANGEIRSRRYTLRDGLVLKNLELQPGFWTGKDWEDVLDAPPGMEWRYEFFYDDITEWLSPTKGQSAGKRQGRPPDYDWEAFWVEAVRLANTPDGLPKTQAEFVSHMADWFVENTGGHPAESLIREKATKIYPKNGRK